MAADKPIKVGRWREAKGASEALNHLQCGLCVCTERDARRGSAAVRDVDEQSSSTDGLREQRMGHVHRIEGLREQKEEGHGRFSGGAYRYYWRTQSAKRAIVQTWKPSGM